MRSPSEMSIIQIDITNACVHKCSNCTRFCGHHEKTFFMDFETFKKAVDSLDDFNGVVGIIGGEPTLHPDFEKMCEYIQKRNETPIKTQYNPTQNWQYHIKTKSEMHHDKKCGLWSSVNKQYYNHLEVIEDTFPYQLLNDHKNLCQHQALLISRNDLNIPDDEWIKKRDLCWIQNTWSATITPKGAFFCEVAGALDMLFHGDGGWDVTTDWWKRTPAEFGEQLRWCEICSACLDVPTRISSDGRDDVSPSLLKKLHEVHSPKINHGDYVLFNPMNYDSSNYHGFSGGNDYMDAGGNKRISSKNNLTPKHIDYLYVRDFTQNKINEINPKDWVAVSKNVRRSKRQCKKILRYVLNPGCVYVYKNTHLFNIRASSIKNKLESIDSTNYLGFYPNHKIIHINWHTMLKNTLESLVYEIRLNLSNSGIFHKIRDHI